MERPRTQKIWSLVCWPSFRSDERPSLMTPQRVTECLAFARDQVAYLGARVKAPADADVEARLKVVASVVDLLKPQD